jgi:hypothetical protein
MGDDSSSQEEMLLAIALSSPQEQNERRLLPDRRSGVDRRKKRLDVPYERRSSGERRQAVRRKVDLKEGSTLLTKARSRLSGRLRN